MPRTPAATRARATWTVSAAAPEGLRYVPELLSVDEEQALSAEIATLTFAPVVMHGVAARRTVVHFGFDYGYESWELTPAPPIPSWLLAIRARVAALAQVGDEAFAAVLIARYPPGATIGWHRDATFFGPVVVGVSVGGAATMRFRRRV